MVSSHKGLYNSKWFNRFPPPKYSYTEAEDNSDIVFHRTIRWHNSRYNNHLSESEFLFLYPRVASLHMLKNSMNENLCSWRVFLDFVLCRLFDITHLLMCCEFHMYCAVKWYTIFWKKKRMIHHNYVKTAKVSWKISQNTFWKRKKIEI